MIFYKKRKNALLLGAVLLQSGNYVLELRMTNPWDKNWLRGLASLLSILAFLASLIPVLFGLLFLTSLLHYSMLACITFLSPIVAILSLFPYQIRPSCMSAAITLFAVLLVIATWCVWLSDKAKGIIH